MEPDKFGQRLYCWDNSETMVNVQADGSIAVNWDGAVYDSNMARLTPESRRRVAALCLFGTTNGFTQADVETLRESAREMELATLQFVAQHPGETFGGDWPTKPQRLAALADKIAALLPPPSPPTTP